MRVARPRCQSASNTRQMPPRQSRLNLPRIPAPLCTRYGQDVALSAYMFHNFWTEISSWVTSILVHWGSLVTGGLIVAVLSVIRDRHPKYLQWTSARRIYYAFLLFSIFQSWQAEYESRRSRESDLAVANQHIESTQMTAKNQINGLATKSEALSSPRSSRAT